MNKSNQTKRKSTNSLPTGWVGLSAVVILLLGLAIGYCISACKNSQEEMEIVVSPTPTELAEDDQVEWTEYKNKSFDLSFEYPNTYSIIREDEIEVGPYFNQVLELQDNTRSGQPNLTLLFNPDGLGGCLGNDIEYETEIVNLHLEVISRTEFHGNSSCSLDDGKTQIGFNIGAAFRDKYGNSIDITKEAGNGIYSTFSFTEGNYERELRKIIKTIEISNPEIYGVASN